MWGKGFFEYEINNRTSGIFVFYPLLKEKRDVTAIIIIVVSVSIIIILTIKLDIIPQWVDLMNKNILTKVTLYLIAVLCSLLIIGLLFRTILWLRYRPLTESDLENIEWPFISIILPSYNESEMIEKAVESVFMADYPKEKIEVIIVDDGSNDGTSEKLKYLKKKYASLLKIIHFKINLGKRRALYSGLKIAKGDIIITIDSDSIIDKDALKNLIVPMILDTKVGAVAGRVAVLNEKQNLLTKMLSVNYSISFDFGRAYQSVFGGVTVCPGALTAYRKNAIKSILKDWVNQEFMGKACTHGEDRHMTSLILKNGYITKYQSNALIYTCVPSNMIQLNRMYIRWTRSYIRESILYLKYLLFDIKSKRRFIYWCDFILSNVIYPFHILLSVILIYSVLYEPIFLIKQIIFLLCISLILSLYYLWNHKNLNFIFGIPYNMMLLLFFWWIFPYCLLTINEPSWLTR
ncbi:MAG: glycosyltransferase [Candidatus Aminicenantes bacterium]|nr:glycosyltransferase [Candidatus Aminicenantes bacterium]